MILVTGGCGYIGSHIVKALSEKGEDIIVYDNLSQGSREALLHGEKLVVGDVTDKDALKGLFATHSIEAVVHLAALVNAKESIEFPGRYHVVNVLGSFNVWEAARASGVKHFMYASSAAVYGTPISSNPIKETSRLKPTNPYGLTKLAGESSLTGLIKEPNNHLIFRFFNVGGAEAAGRLGQSKASRAIMQRLFTVSAGLADNIMISGNDYSTKDGTVSRDYVHVEDVANAFILGLNYLRASGSSSVVNLGSGVPHTIEDVIKEVETVTGNHIDVDYGPRVSGDIDFSLADITHAKKVLNWTPSHTFHSIVYDGWNSYVQREK